MACELGADYLEADVQRTKDGVLIVYHDRTLQRTTDVASVFPERVSEPVESFTFDELMRLDAGTWFNAQRPGRARPAFIGARILRLEDLVAIAEARTPRPGLYLETKEASRYPGIERQLVEVLARRGWIGDGAEPSRSMQARVIFQSFERESLRQFRTLAPRVPRVWLLDEATVRRIGWRGVLAQAGELAIGIGTWGVHHAWSPSWSVADAPRRYVTTWPWLNRSAHRAGLLVHVWTVNARWELRLVRWFGADGVFTDRPEAALAAYGRTGPRGPAAARARLGA
jgi:glycerophosphoryl diester phosphodiesterase